MRVLNLDVPIIHTWIQHAALALWAECVAEQGSIREKCIGWRTELWGKKGQKLGWSKERWAFWKERLVWISKVTVLDWAVKKQAKAMVNMMEEIELSDMTKLSVSH